MKKPNQKAQSEDKNMVGTSIRIDPETLELAKQHGIKVAEVCREALANAVLDVVHKCPTCKRSMRK